MSSAALTMVLTAAVLHAVWNMAAKTARADTTIFVWMYYSLGCTITLPVGVTYMVLSGASYGWELPAACAVTAVLHIGYALLLQTGYRKADLGVVYPVARGVGPMLTMLIAVSILGEHPALLALIGGAVVIGGILIVTGKALFQSSTAKNQRLTTGLIYGSGTGAMIAAYTLWDNFTVNTLGIDPILYFGLGGAFQSVLMLPLVLRKREKIAATWKLDWRPVITIALLSPLAYILVLYALTFTSVALVAPARESSIVIGALLAWWLFKEKDPLRRILGAIVVVIGISLITLG